MLKLICPSVTYPPLEGCRGNNRGWNVGRMHHEVEETVQHHCLTAIRLERDAHTPLKLARRHVLSEHATQTRLG
jgi:hypothetical protein